MTTFNDSDPSSDVWSEWLLHRRHADDPAYARTIREAVERYADRVLDAAGLAPGMTMADVGAGDGLLAFRAIDRVGPSLRVVLTDISAPLLARAEALAVERGVRGQCAFVQSSAEDLAPLADRSIDVVATRAVLAYVSDKRKALAAFHRVLKPGGRLSLAEPIFRDEAIAAAALRAAVESGPPADSFVPLLHRWKAAQFPDTEAGIAASPIASCSERDLLSLAHGAGFRALHLELHIDVVSGAAASWDVFLGTSPHPWAPPLRTILAEQFSPDERLRFERVLRPTVEAGLWVTTDRIAYLHAVK